jgi:metal-sulfur cluster biosynthetic enzyme
MSSLPELYTSTDPQTVTVREALRTVVDPEIGLNVVELGLIRDLTFDTDELQVKMILTTPFCPYGPAMVESVRKAAQSASNLPTFVDIGMEPWSPEMMEEGAGGDWGLF